MFAKEKVKPALLLFVLALLTRLLFYFLGSIYLPKHFLKFVTADTTFYYDPLALKMVCDNSMEISLLSTTRFTFLGYLAMFYRYLGYQHWPISIFHCFLGTFSILLLFLSARLFLKERTAFIIGLIASFQIVLVYWTPFVNTETPFLLVLSFCLFIFSLFIKTRRLIYMLILVTTLIIVPISRPSGIILSVFLLLYLEWLVFKKLFSKKGVIYFYLSNMIILFAVAVLLINIRKNLDRVITQPYPQEVLRLSLYLDELLKDEQGKVTVLSARLTLPPGIKIPKVNKIPVQIKSADILSYFKNHFDKYFALAISRVYTLFNPWVPEYSLKHNIFNSVFYGLIYIFSLVGLIALWRSERDFAILILLIVGSQVLLISLTLIDYDFRYRLPIELILNIPIGVALVKLFYFFHNKHCVI